MGPDDDEWIRDEATDPAGRGFPGGAPAEDEERPDEERPDEERLDEERLDEGRPGDEGWSAWRRGGSAGAGGLCRGGAAGTRGGGWASSG